MTRNKYLNLTSHHKIGLIATLLLGCGSVDQGPGAADSGTDTQEWCSDDYSWCRWGCTCRGCRPDIVQECALVGEDPDSGLSFYCCDGEL